MLSLRRATVDDAEAIADVHVHSWRSGYHGLLPQTFLDGLSVEQRARRWHEIIGAEDSSTVQIVAERDGAIVGFTAFGASREDAADGELWALYVHPDAWSAGVGSALLTGAEQCLADDGFRDVYLWVLDGNDRADRFYRRHGWRADGRTRVERRPDVTLPEHRRHKPLGGHDSPR